MEEYPYEMKFVELIYIGETNERYNNLEKYCIILFSNVTGFMVIDKNGELISKVKTSSLSPILEMVN